MACSERSSVCLRMYSSDLSSSSSIAAYSSSVPCAFGVLTVLDEDQAAKRSYAGENHGESWGKTAVEMAVLRQEALGLAKKGTINLGFSDEESSKAMPKAGVGEKKVFF